MSHLSAVLLLSLGPNQPPLYLDPGSGSLLIQVLIAVLVGAGILVRTQWARIKRLFGRGSPETADDDVNDKDE